MKKLLPLLLLSLVFACKKELVQEKSITPVEGPVKQMVNISNEIKPNPGLLKDGSFGPSVPHFLQSVVVAWMDVLPGDRRNVVFKIPAGRRRVAKFHCPVKNVPYIIPGTDTSQYAWMILKDPSRYYPNMLRLELWYQGEQLHNGLKEYYAFQNQCRPDVPNCDQYTYPSEYMVLYAFSVDYYEGFIDVTDLPEDATFTIRSTINPLGTYPDQDPTDNTGELGVHNSQVVSPVTGLTPIAPHTFTAERYTPAGNGYYIVYWQGTGQEFDVFKDGVLLGTTTNKWALLQLKGKGAGKLTIRSRNIYYPSATVPIAPITYL